MERRQILRLTVLAILLVTMVLAVPQTAFETLADEVVTFPDANLEAVIREAISKPTGDIYQSELEGITELMAGGKGVTNISGLEYCISMERLN